MAPEPPIFDPNSSERKPLSHVPQASGVALAREGSGDDREQASPKIHDHRRARRGPVQRVRERCATDAMVDAYTDESAREQYGDKYARCRKPARGGLLSWVSILTHCAATWHLLEAERPKNRLSYMGEICVVGQTKDPAAVARASTL